jgi:hypothetical protein
MSMKNSNDTIGNRTRDLPGCSAVSQKTAPPRVLSDVAVIFFSSVVELTANGQFFNCVTIAFSERYTFGSASTLYITKTTFLMSRELFHISSFYSVLHFLV